LKEEIATPTALENSAKIVLEDIPQTTQENRNQIPH